MKRKTIEKEITAKFNHFVKSIKDDKVRELVQKNTVVTGGCIASMFLREDVNDFDLYFTNKETVIAVSNYYVNQFKRLLKDNYIEINVVHTAEHERVKILVRSQGVASSPEEDGYETDRDDIESTSQYDSYEQAEKIIDDTTKIISGVYKKPSSKASYQPVYLSSNAITLSDKIQIVIRFYGNPEEIHSNYASHPHEGKKVRFFVVSK